MLAQKAFGSMVKKSNAKTIIQAMQELENKFDNVILVVGQDRVQDFETLLNKYNGKDYTFNSIVVQSAGDRDPDAEGVEGMSASKMRAAAAAGEKDAFISGLPKKIKSMGNEVYDMVRSGMKLAEELERLGLLDEAVLDRQQRRQRAITMRRFKSKIARGRRIAANRPANLEKLKKRARKAAINVVRQKVAKGRGEDYANLDVMQKMQIDKKVQKRKSLIDRLAKRMIPKIRQKEVERRRAKNEEFHAVFVEGVAQDKDIKDRKGTQPAKYHAGVSASTKEKRDAHFKKGAKMDDNNPAAYKPAPGDKEAKTKESKYTKKYKEMYGEAYNNPPTKRFHEVRKKDGSIKLDRRFRAFKSAAKPMTEDEQFKIREMRQTIRKINTEEYDDVELLGLIDQVAEEVLESIDLEESKTKTALQKKADKSGISYGILKKVYDRGVAAWRTGHRPGTTPAQWGMARVNSFITGGKTRTTADKDLWQSRKEEVELDERLAPHIARGDTFVNVPDNVVGKAHDKVRMLKKKNPNIDYSKEMTKALGDLGWQMTVGGEYVRESNYLTLDEQFEFSFMLNEESILDKALAAIDRNVKKGVDLMDVTFDVSRARGVNFSAQELRRKYIEKFGDPNKKAPRDLSALKRKYGFAEEGGAGDRGTEKLTKRYKKDTPGEEIKEDVGTVKHHLGLDKKGSSFKHMMKHATTHVDYDMDGDVDEDDFKKTVPDEITGAEKKDLTKAAFKKYRDELKHTKKGVAFEEVDLDEQKECQLIGMKQIKEFEKVVDKLFEKFGIDFKFTKHFADRMGDERNDPCITLKELADFIKKIYAKQGKSLKGVAGAEAVVKDIQKDLNIPVAVTYDSRNDEFDVVMKTIMRKKNFRTPNKIITY
jgi:hypothetical protein